MTETTKQQVFLIDDDEAVRDAMGMLLESSGLPYRSFACASDFLDNYSNDLRGCLVLDIRMPNMDGLELQSILNGQNSTLPIIFITGHGDIPMAVEAMRLGALDFMRKPINELNLLQAINQALGHETDIRKQIYDIQQSTLKFEALTQREQQIFERVANGQANKSIAFDLGISERTVEVHRAQVMKKLNVKTLAQLVRLKILLE
jgi:FixJ family two-component response regulator|tara:strand:- start:25 stop:636 length:612 start_codon:yes stop_codon:yes gene_type:complete